MMTKEERVQIIRTALEPWWVATGPLGRPEAAEAAQAVAEALDDAMEESLEWVYRVDGDYYNYDSLDVLHLDWTNPDVKILRKPVASWEPMPRKGESI